MREFLTVCEDLRRVADPAPLPLVSISTVLFVTGVGAVHTFFVSLHVHVSESPSTTITGLSRSLHLPLLSLA